jgi:3-methylcrotonyl-CoA carboxylase alpha subunit
MKTARRLGVRTVAVFSDADRQSLHVEMADEAVFIGPAPPRDSYLRTDKILEALKLTGAQAVHPGYGFLSENADFCRLCLDHQIVFIGPTASAIASMGSKSAAKHIMAAAGIAVVPGYHGNKQSLDSLRSAAGKIGYPVLLKATAGGGGKGMRLVGSDGDFTQAFASAKREAMSSFGDDTIIVEKYFTRSRHVEIQVFCDQYGNGVYLFDRDCSLQRRYQKIVEEAPAPGLTAELRQAMGEAGLAAAQAIHYVGAGTVEFLLTEDGAFYFMEMNTRLQVEHPVTEMITGHDLVEWQLRVAAGEVLPARQEELCVRGHAVEARIYAEDPASDFLPATGRLDHLQSPAESSHVRIDTGVQEGDDISGYYDPMIAKLIVWDETRDGALDSLADALTRYRIGGVATNIAFLYNIARSQSFRAADLDTSFLEKHRDELFPGEQAQSAALLPVMGLYLVLRQQRHALENKNPNDPTSPWNLANSWRLNQPHTQALEVELEGKAYSLSVNFQPGSRPKLFIRVGEHHHRVGGTLRENNLFALIDGRRQRFTIVPQDHVFTLFSDNVAICFKQVEHSYESDVTDGGGRISAPMNGTLIELSVGVGEFVSKGETLLIMEAMKMEHRIKAPADGCVGEFFYQPGDLVDAGGELLTFVANL